MNFAKAYLLCLVGLYTVVFGLSLAYLSFNGDGKFVIAWILMLMLLPVFGLVYLCIQQLYCLDYTSIKQKIVLRASLAAINLLPIW